MNKVNATVETLKARETRTRYESVRLANAIYKVESRTLSKIYKELSKAEGELKEIITEILGDYKFPEFKEFVKKAPEKKEYFSIWNGLNMIKKFNLKAEQKKKAAKQQKNEAKKTMEIVKVSVVDKLMKSVESKGKAKSKAKSKTKGKAKIAA